MYCRVGMEDSLRVRRDRQAEGNGDLVEVALSLADLLGRPVATPAELRARLTRWDRADAAARPPAKAAGR
jgi:uncharacterized protein (DUF849 family)